MNIDGTPINNLDLILYAYCIDLMAIVIIMLYWYFGIHRKGNVYILKKNKGMYIQVKHLRISKETEKVSLSYKKEKKSFMIEPSFFDGNKPNAFLDWDTGHVILFKDIIIHLSPNEQDIFLEGKILPQLIRGLLTEHLNLILLIIGCIASFVIGLYISPYIPSPTSPIEPPVQGG